MYMQLTTDNPISLSVKFHFLVTIFLIKFLHVIAIYKSIIGKIHFYQLNGDLENFLLNSYTKV